MQFGRAYLMVSLVALVAACVLVAIRYCGH